MSSDAASGIDTHPVQTGKVKQGRAPTIVTLRAYEVYSYIFSPQTALITGECRGGFGAGELIALLYARGFPKDQWGDRFRDAMQGLSV